MKQLLIAGGGIAGFQLIKSLLSGIATTDLRITLADPQHDFVFKPILYEQLNGRIVSVNRSAFFRAHADQLTHKPQRVTHCEFDNHLQTLVSFEDGSQQAFDMVALALGAKTNYFGVKGAAEHCLPLLTQADMVRFKQSLDHKLTDSAKTQKPASFEIIGGGLSGIELAFELRAYLEREAPRRYGQFPTPRITMIEAMPTILPGFGQEEIQLVMGRLKTADVTVLTGHQVQAIAIDRITVKHGDQESVIASCEPLWVAGVMANLPEGLLPESVECYRGSNRIKVTPQLTLPGYPNVFVIGDIAGVENPKTGRLIPTTGQLSEQQAAYVAKLLKCRFTRGHMAANYAGFVPDVRGHFVSLGPEQAAMTLDAAGPLTGKTLSGGLIAKLRHTYYATKMKV